MSSAPQVDSPGSVGKKKIRLGVCALDKKSRSKPMAEILSRLDPYLFEIIIFGNKRILEDPVESWPEVDALIAFYSAGFPLERAEKYVELRNPFVLNDLGMQRTLMDRRKVYDLMEASGIDVPRHVYISRDGYRSKGSGQGDPSGDSILHEHDDHIEINGVVINKPFVEKPVDADDHNVHIYYPSSAGGGCKKLFRKVKNRSSEFYEDINNVRQTGSYIYEEFVETQGTDVKMYTVGPDYGHAEARKSPAVDGKVMRDSDGKEIRYPVILSLREKEIARRIVLVFKQQVCGFDLLRVQEGDGVVSYCCDVNGWSFVKNSRKYYDDCAQLLCEYMLAALKPRVLQGFSAIDPLLSTYATIATSTPTKGDKGIMGDSFFSDPKGEEPLTPEREGDSEVRTINTPLVNQPTTLSEGAPHVREISNALSVDPPSRCSSAKMNSQDMEDERERRERSGSNADSNQDSWNRGEVKTHQEELRCVIAVIRHGDRTPKQKLKLKVDHQLFLDFYQKHAEGIKKDLKLKAKQPLLDFLNVIKTIITEIELKKGANFGSKLQGNGERMKKINKELYKLLHMRDILERWKISGLNRKLQIKPVKAEGDKVKQLQLIMKWGGNLTKLGERQAMTLGQRFRHEMYPDPSGGGILRLHSTFRHDLKIKTSDEGRVMKTAAAFAKGMLELEGDLPPILVSLVHKEKDSMHMLDPSGNKEVKASLEKCKETIHQKLQEDIDFSELGVGDDRLKEIGVVSQDSSLLKALKEIKNPRDRLFEIHSCIGELLEQLDDMLGTQGSEAENVNEGEGLKAEGKDEEGLSGIKLYKGETLLELTERWRLLYKKLLDDETEDFDLTKIPDVHDNVRFDMLHNPHLGLTKTLVKLYRLAKLMADCVVPQEYGITIQDKRDVGAKMCRRLIEKIKYDLIIAKTDNQVDMRYMIDLSHSADLNINTLGRRIRTRLYFTSESHLHTLLNVLRFTETQSDLNLESPLDNNARKMIKSTPELCYLTQIVLRLFEDPLKDLDDPKRYRVEIGFSAGATSTPLHMSEKSRDGDTTRFDTNALTAISKDMLTCQELEDYFDESIKYGYTEEDSEEEKEKARAKEKESKKKFMPDYTNSRETSPTKKEEAAQSSDPLSPPKKVGTTGGPPIPLFKTPPGSPGASSATPRGGAGNAAVSIGRKDDDFARAKRGLKILAKKWLWGAIASLSLGLGVLCFTVARRFKIESNAQRRWTNR